MSTAKIGVGIIGASPERGWASDAHIPALQLLDDRFEIAALSTSRAESARQASEKFGVAKAFDNHAELVACAEVDLVAVTVKVPHHFELVDAALKAGKAVYCEWPLGNGLAEAEAMARQSEQAGVYTAVGLQARAAPVVRYVRDLLADGKIGEILSSTIVADAVNWGADILDCYRYLLDERNGATMLSIPFGHTLDAFCHCLGGFRKINATTATRRPKVRLAETGEMLDSNVADQIAINGELENGAVASIHFRGGLSKGTNFQWEINGTKGDLVLRAGGGHIQMMPLSLFGALDGQSALSALEVPDTYDPIRGQLSDQPMAASVARAYAHLSAEWRGIQSSCAALPGFQDAVQHHQLLTRISRSALRA